MPKIPVDEAPAGPEMDAAVVEALGECGHFLKLENLKLEGMELRAGGSRCVKCGQRFAGLAYGEGYCVKPYSTDIAAAWEVHKIACDMLLTREYLQAIQEQTRLEGGSLVEWPDVLVFLVHIFPEAICRAFLKANGVEYVEVSE